MVKGLRSLERKLGVSIPDAVRKHLRSQMAVFADKIVESAEGFVAQRTGALLASIGWVWGTAIPDGAMALGTVGTDDGDDDLVITVFAGNDEAYWAKWVEFGTQPHSLTTNASVKRGLRQDGPGHPGTVAQPFFFPAYRLQKKGGKARMTRAIRNGLKEGSR